MRWGKAPVCRAELICGRAFTLVEVVMALGLVAFALVGLFGLMAVGMNSSRSSVMLVQAANLSTLLTDEFRITGEVEALQLQKPPEGWVAESTTQRTALGPVFLRSTGEAAPREEADFRCEGVLTIPPNAALPSVALHLVLTWPAGVVERADGDSFETLVTHPVELRP